MKVKLLKKLRKRYNWYFNKDNFPVLIDHKEETVDIYDLESIMNRVNYSLEDVEAKVKVSHPEWALRFLKKDILGSFGWSLDKIRYKHSYKKYKRKLPK